MKNSIMKALFNGILISLLALQVIYFGQIGIVVLLSIKITIALLFVLNLLPKTNH